MFLFQGSLIENRKRVLDIMQDEDEDGEIGGLGAPVA